VGQRGLHVTHLVVAETAHQAAAEAGQTRGGSHPETFAVAGQEIQRIGILFLFRHPLAGEHQHLAAIDRNTSLAGQTDEGIAAKPFPPLDRFQEVGIGGVGQLQINGKGSVEIGKGLEGHRDTVVALGGKRLKFVFCHGRPRKRGELLNAYPGVWFQLAARARTGHQSRLARGAPPGTTPAPGGVGDHQISIELAGHDERDIFFVSRPGDNPPGCGDEV